MPGKRTENRILIVGAGVAGLTCARDLTQAGIQCTLIEARNRLGGRILTEQTVELGSEFIHGAEPASLKVLEKHHIPFIDIVDEHLSFLKSKKKEDFWGVIEGVSEKLRQTSEDRSIGEFLEAHRRGIPPQHRDMYRSYVEGFHGADTELISEHALAEGESAEEPELNSRSQFRVLPGYRSLVDALYRDIDQRYFDLQLNTRVESVEEERYGLRLKCYQKQPLSFSGAKVVLTVPVPLLKTMIFHPPIPSLQKALSTLHMGHVQKIIFEFSERFWEKLSEKPVSFLHASMDQDFPVWWTQMPVRNGFLTAWQGGPRAYEMSSWSTKQRIEKAIKTLSNMTGKSAQELRKLCIGIHLHDWTEDQLSRGAYSYVGVKNEEARKDLQKVFRKNIYIAGEATADEKDRGTVHGAILSGERSARQILKSFEKKSSVSSLRQSPSRYHEQRVE